MQHIVTVCIALLVFLTALGAPLVSHLVNSCFEGVDFINLALYIFATTCYLVLMFTVIHRKAWDHSFAKIWQELNLLHFHGFKIRRYLENETFSRLQEWLGSGMCHELAVLAMLVLKPNKTATLCHGNYYDADGNFQTHHSWVEFKIPFNGWYVADFSWIDIGFVDKKKYFTSDNGELKPTWSCSYDDFWDLPFPNVLYEAIKSPKTSKILFELTAFCGHTVEDGGFKEWCYSGQKLRYSDGTFMIPFLNDKGKPVSTIIIRDFVKNPKRKQPKARSIRRSRLVIRHYSIWRSQQKVTYSESSQ